MGKLYENIAVIDEKNQIIFDKINDEEFCSEFFGQVLVAFDALTKHIAEGELSNIEWGDKLIALKKKENLIFLACCNCDVKEERVRDELDNISKRFFDIYSKILVEDFDGDRKMFESSEKRFLKD